MLRSIPLLFLALVASSHADTTVTLPASADTCLFEFLPDYNWGKQTEVVAGTLGDINSSDDDRCRALIKFDVASVVPAGSTISDVRLVMSITKAPGGQAPATFDLLRVLVPWEEGDKDSGGMRPGGEEATAGETTWQWRFHDSTPWSSPGGKLEVDFDPESGEVQIEVQGLAGVTYALQTRPDLNSGNWSDVDTMAATSDAPLSLNSTAPDGSKRLFYRVAARFSP